MKRSFGILTLLISIVLGVSGCASGSQTTQPEVRAEASTARIALVVEQNTIRARALQDQVAGDLRQLLLETGTGVPVEDADEADLVLRVHIREVNFTHATAWEWQLIDRTGATVMSRPGSSGLGVTADRLAKDIVSALAAVDTMAYALSHSVSTRSFATAPANTTASALSAGLPRSATHGENAWAVIIGIEQYRESLPAASGAEADAMAFAAFAQHTLNVPELNIRLLLGERASKADILATLTEWLPRNAREPGSRVYVFFSGHGAPDVEAGTSFLVPYDGNPTFLRSTGLSIRELHESLEGLEDQEVFVFLDACFSGHGERSVLPEGTRPLVPVQKFETSPSIVTFSASGPSETTGAHQTSGHGLFSHFLIEGLKGTADSDGDGHVSIGELEAYVVDSVRREARRQNRDQTPNLDVPAAVDRHSALVHDLQRD